MFRVFNNSIRWQNLVVDLLRQIAFSHCLCPDHAGVAPGPIWTPLIPGTFPDSKVESFGTEAPMGRAGEPHEVATSFLFLASEDASYFSGQVLHPNGTLLTRSFPRTQLRHPFL